MLLVLKFNRKPEEEQLTKAGYEKRKYGDWIRKDENGRWHVHRLEKGVFSIHYDLYVDGTHFSPKLPIATKAEIKRIIKANITTSHPMSRRIREFFHKVTHKYPLD